MARLARARLLIRTGLWQARDAPAGTLLRMSCSVNPRMIWLSRYRTRSMRLRWKLMIAAGAVAATAAAAYGEFVLDIRTPRASLVEIHAITSSVSILMADYHHAVETMKKKYGPDAQTVLETQPPRLITRISGKVVEQDRAPGQFSDARGLFVIGPRG